MSLSEYRKKRKFKKTPEPKGRVSRAKAGALHFVVQKHDASQLHYDFRLELDGVLKSWAVPKGPSMNPANKRLAMMTEDHPLSYADFEGKIPEGHYGAGDVIVWDRGAYMSAKTSDLEESRKKIKSGFFKGELKIVLLGEKLKGGFTLIKMKPGDDKYQKSENAWLLVKTKDEYASKMDITKELGSVISGKTLPRDTQGNQKKSSQQKKKKTGKKNSKKNPPSKSTDKKSASKRDPFPHRIKPMLAKLTDEAFDRKKWIFEVKWDGYRAITEKERGKVRLYSRNGLSFNEKYPSIVDALESIPHDCILDGEIVALSNGRADFHTLQQYGENHAPLQYAIFDLLYLDGKDLRREPLLKRKKLLQEILPDHPTLLYSEHVEEHGKRFFQSMGEKNLEGMIAKDGKSPYREGIRGDEWLKVKSFQEQEAVIVGFTKPRGARKLLGALVLAVYQGKDLRYIGHSGGGFTKKEIADLHRKLEKIKQKTPTLREKVPVNSPITWVKPKYVCEVKFSEWTESGRMRHPIYAGLRVDKAPQEVTKETPALRKNTVKKSKTTRKTFRKISREQMNFTNLEKVFWKEEGYTKGDLIEYYDRMSSVLLPYLIDRPQNLNRHPNGIDGKSFFQKNFTADLPEYVETKEIWSESNQAYLRYVICQNRETLLYLANLGCIELNPWNSRISSLEQPDYMILDLDPGERSFEDLIVVAQEVKKVLDLACGEHYPKTSGKTGLHVLIPFRARYSYEDIKDFALLLMSLVHERLPDLTSLERNPAKRGGKIYLDYLQNRFGQTLACAYSIRPFPHATVSTPLEWSEVRKGLDPKNFTIKTIWKRLEKKGDLWRPVLSQGIDLSDSLRCLQEFL
ncbi:MAG TPA: DNA ligase D [Candidatus Paceibacterota bacterium]|nr:DNA ligase D [Candidatus Paceibacterota bacterium]